VGIPVSSNFLAAQEADVNQPVAEVSLIIGDYCHSAAYLATAISSGDFSADFPALGATDGDHTELNMGPAATSENGIGRSSWKSSAIPGSGGSAILTIDFHATRTINRIKLYHVNGHGIKSYSIQYWDGAAWQYIAATSDVVTGIGGYGDGGYGDLPYGGATVSAVSITTTKKLDVINFPDVTTTQIRLNALDTEVALEPAQVVAIEAYRVIDISDRVKSVSISRSRDYKLNNNLATEATVACDNLDRYFSTAYFPTAAEAASGFVNPELRPGLGLVIKHGFAFGGTSEVVTTFTGTLDSLSIQPTAREASLVARDGMKALIDQVVNTKLKLAQDIGTNVQYLLNLAGISTYESIVDLTSIPIDYFFAESASILTIIQNLVQASGDATFFFDENGIASFFMFMNNAIPQQRVFTSKANWEAGAVQVNTDTVSSPGALGRAWYLISDFSGGTYTPAPPAPSWTVAGQTGNATIGVVSSHLESTGSFVIPSAPAKIAIQTPWPLLSPFHTGTISLKGTLGAPNLGSLNLLLWESLGSTAPTGYGLYAVSGSIYFARWTGTDLWAGGVPTMLISLGAIPVGEHTWAVSHDSGANFTVYLDGASLGTVNDATYFGYSSLQKITFLGIADGAGESYSFSITDIYYSTSPILPLTSVTTAIATWEPAPIDQGALITDEGLFVYSEVLGGSAINAYYTATSDDNITYGAWFQVLPYGSSKEGGGSSAPYQIRSTPRRWLKVRATPDPNKHVYELTGQTYIYDITVNWTTGAGRTKYSATPSMFIRYDTTGLELSHQSADNLGGDTAILNEVKVASSPIILTGTSADTAWQGTTNTPPEAIAVANPLSVSVGTLVFNCVVNGGMDTSLMSGASPAAAVVTFAGGAAGSWVFSTINPTLPVLTLTITSPGTITDLRVVGKKFSATETPYIATVTDAQSKGLYGKRSLFIQNDYIINSGIAGIIANRLVSNFKTPILYIPNHAIRPAWSLQLGDRVNVVDDNTGINGDFYVAGLGHTMAASLDSAQAGTDAVFIKIV